MQSLRMRPRQMRSQHDCSASPSSVPWPFQHAGCHDSDAVTPSSWRPPFQHAACHDSDAVSPSGWRPPFQHAACHDSDAVWRPPLLHAGCYDSDTASLNGWNQHLQHAGCLDGDAAPLNGWHQSVAQQSPVQWSKPKLCVQVAEALSIKFELPEEYEIHAMLMSCQPPNHPSPEVHASSQRPPPSCTKHIPQAPRFRRAQGFSNSENPGMTSFAGQMQGVYDAARMSPAGNNLASAYAASQRLPPSGGANRPPQTPRFRRTRTYSAGEGDFAAFASQTKGTPNGSRMTPMGNYLASVDTEEQRKASATSTMKLQLQALQNEDPSTVFIARRINKLGFTSADTLRSYFSKYGEVKCVYVSHSRVKSVRPDTYWRMRAAALGFVVMFSQRATASILADGPDHLVGDTTIQVHTFHRHGHEPDEEQDTQGAIQKPAQALVCAEHGAQGYGHQHYRKTPEEGSMKQYGDNGWSCTGTANHEPKDGGRAAHGSSLLLAACFARYSEQELYNAQPEQYED
uniref:RRM domain-containing protein n=1 Tax=Alexandrium monilatum TaxID=311494 RepID=A0A7S4VIJ3_9DINO